MNKFIIKPNLSIEEIINTNEKQVSDRVLRHKQITSIFDRIKELDSEIDSGFDHRKEKMIYMEMKDLNEKLKGLGVILASRKDVYGDIHV